MHENHALRRAGSKAKTMEKKKTERRKQKLRREAAQATCGRMQNEE
jgi:hypothetical protein